MTIAANPQQEREDFKRRQELQAKLQEAVRRSAPDSEVKKIQVQIEELNRKLESYSTHMKRPSNP
jgi:hypothetical protein